MLDPDGLICVQLNRDMVRSASLCECAARRAPEAPAAFDKLPADEQTTGPPETGGVPEDGDFVANTKSAEKAALQAEKHRTRNVALRSRMRTAVRGVAAAIASGDKEAARVSYQKAVPVIDSLVSKQIVHRNKAARHKSRLAARIRAMH
jgi:small subunit ribosomal protein S20